MPNPQPIGSIKNGRIGAGQGIDPAFDRTGDEFDRSGIEMNSDVK